MTIEKARLKALAEKNIGLADVPVAPDVILDLLADIEKLTTENARLREDRDGLLEEGGHLL